MRTWSLEGVDLLVLVGSRDRVEGVDARRREAVDGVIQAVEADWQKLEARREKGVARG